ncbi:MAG: N-6 DNA methylase [Verrucomicrobiaceae bacterium]|nr:N-6 DNA methylase [Verrucomicrobiaceae bacterium]
MSRRRKLTDTTPFDTLRLEGTLFVPELLERAARGEAAHQKEADYAIPKGLKLHDEYGRAYRIAAALWQDFAPQLLRTDLAPARATHAFVLDLLRQCLGFTDLTPLSDPVQIGDRGFPVTTQALGGRLPVIIAPHSLALDDPDPRFAILGSGARRKSAHQLAQEFLNASRDCLWAIVTNGRSLRLLRDAETLTRPNFLEFDLETILREGEARYADFSALWRIAHASRAGTATAPPADCIWEKWKSEGHAQGLRVREGLRAGVTQALLILGRGFLTHPDNLALRQRLHDGTLTKEDYFQQLLRLIYRSLFLFCAEERDLLHTPAPSSAVSAADSEKPQIKNPICGFSESVGNHQAARKAYAEGYSLRRLRNRSLRQTAHDSHGDLWLSLRIVFHALASGQPRLALPALGGLFAETQCPDLDSASLANRDLLAGMRQLRWSSASGSLTAIDYRNMGPEELGSVYESLLELVPQLDLPARTFGFAGITDTASTSGNARKTTGSYYTPDSLVQELIKSALDPVIADRLAAQPDRPIDALLSITVCDPSCGSGHFLLAAARRLAEKLAELRAPDGAVRPDDYRHALREVIARCIHGVDRNPLALELARTVLWLEGVDPGLPLSFLEHHLVCGDALLGLTDLRQLENGIPDAAFTALSGDDKKLCTDLKKQNKAARKQLDDLRSGQDLLAPPGQPDALSEFSALESLPEATPEEIAAKEAAWLAFLTHTRESPLARAADVFVGAFLAPKPTGSTPPDTRALAAALFPAKATPELTTQIEHARQLCDRDHANVLHWPLAFPKVFARGGFDCILGNPPWERIKLQEEEFFATREPLIATAKNKSERAKRIQWLSEGSLRYHLSQFQSPATPDPTEIQLFRDFEMEKRLAEASSIFAHVDGKEGGRYPLTGVGDVNTYALFSETILQLTSPRGKAGFIVPTGIVSDDTTKQFFSAIAETGRLTHLFSFENEEFVFPAVHHSFRFCLMVIAGAPDPDRPGTFVFLARQTDQLQDDRRRFTLSPEDFRLINPNTRTCPIFRARADAELTRAIYRRVPVLIEEARDGREEKNPWGITFQRMFDMSNDSHLFEDKPGPDLLPLYEAKMIHQFDHRWASYTRTEEGELDTADVTAADKADPAFAVTPRYWVPRSAVEDALLSKQDPLYPLHIGAREKRRDSLAWWFRCWLWGHELLTGNKTAATRLRQEMDDARIVSHDTMEIVMAHEPERQWAERTATTHPLSADEQTRLWNQIEDDQGLISRDPNIIGGKNSDQLSEEWESLAEAILAKRRKHWVMGWRRNARNHDLRSMILSAMPSYGMGDSVFLLATEQPTHMAAVLLANANSLVLDFALRQKLAGINLSFFYIKQLPILPPEAYSEADIAYIVPRVLELTYTAHDLRPWAEDVISSYQRQFPQHPALVPDPADPQPYRFDPDRRAQLRADLDARYARLYGLTRDELRYILDPADTHGPDYPTETFRVLKTNELKQHGEYRTRRLVLEAWDKTNS